MAPLNVLNKLRIIIMKSKAIKKVREESQWLKTTLVCAGTILKIFNANRNNWNVFKFQKKMRILTPPLRRLKLK